MLETSTVVRIPDADRTHEFTQVIYVPVLALLFTEMPRYAGLYTTRPERTSNIDVIADFELNRIPPAYPGRGS